MSRIRIVGGNYTKITGGKHIIHSEESIEFNSLKKIYEKGEKKGILHGDFEERPVTEGEFIIDGEWLDKNGKAIDMNKSPHTKIGEIIFFKVKTKDIPKDTALSFELWESDGISIKTVLGTLIDTRAFDDFVPLQGEKAGAMAVTANIDKDGYAIFSVELTEYFEQYIKDDSGAFIELYFIARYFGHEFAYLPRDTSKYLKVGHSDRTIFIKPADEKYKLPEFLDSVGNFIVFLANESGAVAGNFDSTIQYFHTVKVRVLKDYSYHSNFSAITKKIYKQTYNMSTGLSTHLDLFEETEKVEFRIRKNSKQIFKEEEYNKNVKKRIADYFNVNDIGKTGLNGVQKSLEILGYLDYWNDVQSIAKGEKVPGYDAIGVVVNTAEIAAQAAGSPIKIPMLANAAMFGLAVFEATIVAGVIRDMDEFVENAMTIELENAKLKGLEGVRKLFDSNKWISDNYSLERNISQEIVNEILKGKRRKYNSIALDIGKYPISSSTQMYDILFKILPEDEKVADTQYLLEAIIMQ